jgi:IS5 family transposase
LIALPRLAYAEENPSDARFYRPNQSPYRANLALDLSVIGVGGLVLGIPRVLGNELRGPWCGLDCDAGDINALDRPAAKLVSQSAGDASDYLMFTFVTLPFLAEKVIDQTTRRAIHGEKVHAAEKLVSVFEPHTDIIIKGRRDVEYAHKICVTGGTSSMVLDCVIPDGNPADSTLATPMIDRQVDIYKRPPRQAAFDGGFASKANVGDIKERGVNDVAFHKRRGIKVHGMVKSTWVYHSLRRFRAGIEGVLSFLSRCFGLARCTWKGLAHFKSYVWGSVVSANLLILARHRLARAAPPA